MRTQELWIDLSAHSGTGSEETWPVRGQWRCVEDGRALWLISGFVQTRPPRSTQPEPVTVGRVREILKNGRREEVGEIIFPRLVQTTVPGGGAGSSLNLFGTPPQVNQFVARTIEGLALDERLAIGLFIDPILAGDLDLYPAQELLVPASQDRKPILMPIAQRTDVCIFQMQQTVNRNPRPVIPDWQTVRLLEITPAQHDQKKSWSTRLEQIPATELRSCVNTDADAVKRVLLEYRPHVIVNHDATALESGLLGSAYLVATVLPDDQTRGQYQSLAKLLADGATSVLAMRDMASDSSFALQMIETLCQRGTLTDAVLEMHGDSENYRDVTVCSNDLRLRLRAAAGHATSEHTAEASATAWIPLGDRLHGALGDSVVRIVALSGHTVKARAKVARQEGRGEFRLKAGHASVAKQIEHAKEIERRCSELAESLGHHVSGELTVVDPAVPGLDSGPAVMQACEAAVLRALTGGSSSSPADSYLLVPEDLAERSDGTFLPSISPVVIRRGKSGTDVAVGSVPWQPDPTRLWRSWDFRAETTEVITFDVVLIKPFWSTLEAAVPQKQIDWELSDKIERHVMRLKNWLFPVSQFPIAREFNASQPPLVMTNRVLWPTAERSKVGPNHTILVPEAPGR